MKAMEDKIKIILKDDEVQHSDFQVEHFIIGKQGDVWAQYKQCLREIKGRIESIRSIKDQIEVFRTKANGSRLFWPSKKNRAIDAVNKKRAIEQINNLLNDVIGTERELGRFVSLAEKLKAELGEISAERRYQLETESWKNKGIKMAAIDILATGRISNQTYDFIFSLPKDSQLELFAKLSNQQPMALLGFEPDEIRAITKK
jgi:hypothetical protein